MTGLTVALDIGSDKMVMAVASDKNGNCFLKNVKMIASQGVTAGIVTDFSKVKSYVQYLLNELKLQGRVEVLNVSLPAEAFWEREHRVSVPIQKKTVNESDLVRAQLKCQEMSEEQGYVLIDMLPMAYVVDKGAYIAHPLGKPGRNLDVRYKVYKANADYVSDLKRMFTECGVEQVEFFPQTRAYMEALDVTNSDRRVALVDLGASHIGLMLFNRGILEYDLSLPVGTHAIDSDIVQAFHLENLQQAKQLKHVHGVAIRSSCKNEKLPIPEINKQIEKRDLAKVIQCRMEELLEGAVCQLQQWGYREPEMEILLTGGGSQLKDAELLLNKLSGQKVGRSEVIGISAENEALLQAPACLAVFGLLFCEHVAVEEEKGGLKKWINGLFGL